MKIAIVFFPPEYSNNNFFSCIENKFPPVFHRIVRNASPATTRAGGCRHFQIFIGNLCRRSIRLDSNLYAIASEHTLTPIRHLLQRDPTALASVKFNYFPFRTPCAQLSRRNWRGIDCATAGWNSSTGEIYFPFFPIARQHRQSWATECFGICAKVVVNETNPYVAVSLTRSVRVKTP